MVLKLIKSRKFLRFNSFSQAYATYELHGKLDVRVFSNFPPILQPVRLNAALTLLLPFVNFNFPSSPGIRTRVPTRTHGLQIGLQADSPANPDGSHPGRPTDRRDFFALLCRDLNTPVSFPRLLFSPRGRTEAPVLHVDEQRPRTKTSAHPLTAFERPNSSSDRIPFNAAPVGEAEPRRGTLACDGTFKGWPG